MMQRDSTFENQGSQNLLRFLAIANFNLLQNPTHHFNTANQAQIFEPPRANAIARDSATI
ncbi:hypothetical protein [Helicobacter sp. MIT 05-5294]|uniref:hypothetical protein n=1 Tax=Helicobacter sp. MIT 05-5294 TaxID=1548150 RepID=UPI00051FDC04|nr:hypothetical protein [Helicobacter sp. MIT 05-5294]TLD85736.1 hypothetical protein LS69_008025 [Helicobacter sp. MIT 05-5294]